jgi:HK97 family phage prohead protease
MPAPSPRRLPLIVCDAVIDRHRRLQLVAADAVVQAATGTPAATDRTLRGLVLPYAADGRTSAGRVRASAGRVHWAPELRRIKVFVGHDRTRPVGYVTALRETTDGLTAELHIASTPDGDAALLEAREGTRDALSVELEDVELDDDGELITAELAAVALVPLPAFSDARIAAERDDDQDDDQAPPTRTPPAGPADRRSSSTRAPAALTASRRRQAGAITLDAAAAQLSAAYVDGGRTAAALNAALADITPTSTTSAATNPVQWLGELWTPEYQQLDWAQAVTSATLTGMRLTGWKRLPAGPQISPYPGDKAPIPTDGTLGFEPVNLLAHRHAVGADFDRIWLDFGDESVMNTWLRLVSQDYAKKLDAAIGALVIAEATAVATPAADVIAAVAVAAQTLKKAGAKVNWIAIATDLYAEYLGITSAEAPWWLAQSSAVDLSGAAASVNNLSIFESTEVPAGTVLAGDRRAVTQYTPRGNPFTVRAVDLANGGIDAGVFGYSAEIVNDPLGVVSVTVTAVP